MKNLSQFCVVVVALIIFFNVNESLIGQDTSVDLSKTPWSIRMVESEMYRRPHSYTNSWGYVEGTVLKGVEELWRTTKDEKYFQYIQNSVESGFLDDGRLKSYNYSDFSLDEICE